MRQVIRLIRYVLPFIVQLLSGVVLLAAVGFLEAFRLVLLKPVLDREMGWTNEQYGYVNSAFQATYAVSYVVFGWFAPRDHQLLLIRGGIT